jgi:uncharacterized membrane protein
MITDRWGDALGELRSPAAARRWRTWGPLIAGAALMAYGIALRRSTFSYTGPPTQGAFNTFVFAHLGAYSDIASLYFRNHMWQHALPYVHYPFEYPVGTGLFAWVASLVGSGVGGYLAVSAAVLALCGLLTIWLIGRLHGANPWLLALSPALATYVVLNWDLLSIAALVLALVLFDRRRDSWGAVALGVATWTKFFPIIALPVLLWFRLLDARHGRERVRVSARIVVPFLLTSVAFNAPFMFKSGPHGSLVLSSNWLHFFRYNARRTGGGGLWALIDHGHLPLSAVNAASFTATFVGIALVLAASAWARRRRGALSYELLGPAMLACFGVFFFFIKIYSPQYGLWVMALLAIAGAPVALAVAFASADLAFFVSAFASARMGPNDTWFNVNVVNSWVAVREAVLLVVLGWAVWSIVKPRVKRPPPPAVVEPDELPILTGVSEQ